LHIDNQRLLYQNIIEDYPEITDRKKQAEQILNNKYFNALQVKFAYSVTCHKAQGGQWSSVFIDLGYFSEDMVSLDFLRLLYTAFTRATKKMYLVNFPDLFFDSEND
jgi:exodeoxyribonuclease-5